MDLSSLRGAVEGVDWQQYAPYTAALLAALLALAVVYCLLGRRRAGKRLREKDELHRVVAEQVAEAIFVFDAGTGRVLEAGAAAGDLLGYSSSELAGKTIYDLVARGQESIDADLKRIMAEGRVSLGEQPYRRKDGMTLGFEADAGRVSYGGRDAVCVVARDVTERRRAERELRKVESRYRTLVEQIPAVVYIKDVETGEMLYESPRVREILGYPADAYARDPGYRRQIIHPGDRERVMEAEEQALGSGLLELEYRCFGRDGRVVWLRDEAKVLRDEEGEPRLWQGVAFDVTERRKLEAALAESEERYRSLTRISPDVVAIQSEDRFVHVNDAGARVLGASSPQEIVGRRVLDFVHPRSRETAEEWTRRLRKGERVDLLEERWVRLDGEEIDVEVAAAPVVYGGKPAAQIVLRDVTGRKNAERELVRHKAELARSNAELEQFAYLVANDLRAPLRSLDGFSQVLLEDYTASLDEKGRRYLERIRSSSRRMLRKLDDLLDLSRVTRAEMRRESVDLSAMARSIANQLRQKQPDRRVEFIVAGGLTTQGDRRLLRVALTNLLENAWKFTQKTSWPRIVFGQIQRDHDAVFFVRDNGVGFDMAYAGKLFSPFQRLHPDEEFEGDGTGLAAVMRVIERHGGKIWAEGAEDQGATFYFTLQG